MKEEPTEEEMFQNEELIPLFCNGKKKKEQICPQSGLLLCILVFEIATLSFLICISICDFFNFRFFCLIFCLCIMLVGLDVMSFIFLIRGHMDIWVHLRGIMFSLMVLSRVLDKSILVCKITSELKKII